MLSFVQWKLQPILRVAHSSDQFPRFFDGLIIQPHRFDKVVFQIMQLCAHRSLVKGAFERERI